ncbi:MAG: hypothetical protein JRC87_11425 [Deltaproteobacteria bacterium]|nr:hypothetical protein [Deltaproteobacteria bacterium]
MPGILDDANESAPVDEPAVDDNTGVITDDPSGEKPVTIIERPDYIDEKFWNSDTGEANVEGMAKSYSDLRKAFNDKNNDKPGEKIEDYLTGENWEEDGSFKSGEMVIAKDDPALKMAFEAAKDAGLGLKQAQGFVAKFVAGMGEFAPKEADAGIDTDAEMAKLGKNANRVVTGIKTWVNGMKTTGDINDEVYNEILQLGSTAAGIKALDVLRQKTGEMALPTGEAITGETHMSSQDWYAADFKTHAEGNESRSQYDARMHEIGKKIFGTGSGSFDGSGLGFK